MIDKTDYKSAKFNNYLNQRIKFTSMDYYEKQQKNKTRENLILNDENYTNDYYFSSLNASSRPLDEKLELIELDCALKRLSAVEQAVISYLFTYGFTPDEVSKILKICTKSVSRIKLRALDKLKKYIEGGIRYGK